MNFYFCLAVLFVFAFLAQTSAVNNDELISDYSRSSAIGNSSLNNNAGQADNVNGQYGYGQGGYRYSQDGHGYGQEGYIHNQVGYDNGQVGNINDQHSYGKDGYGYGQDYIVKKNSYDQVSYGNGKVGSISDQHSYGKAGYDQEVGYGNGQVGSFSGQHDYGKDSYGYGQVGFGYGQEGYSYDQVGYGNGKVRNISGQHDYSKIGYGYGQDSYGYGQDSSGYGQAGNVSGQHGPGYGQAGNGNVKYIRRRALLRDTACFLPNTLKDSEVNCRIYSAKIVCNHTCMFGFTLSDGIQRQMECNYKEDKWTPVPEFESCKPFVDCGVTMGPGGGYTCQKDFMDKGPICEIFCEPYEDKDAVKAQTYSCDIEGKWTPELPFCAKPGSGLNLVPAPSVRQISGPLANHS